MSDVVYLYSYGKRRHIQQTPGREGYGYSFCGVSCETEDSMAAVQHRWFDTTVAERRIAKAKALPVCKRCEKAVTP